MQESLLYKNNPGFQTLQKKQWQWYMEMTLLCCFLCCPVSIILRWCKRMALPRILHWRSVLLLLKYFPLFRLSVPPWYRRSPLRWYSWYLQDNRKKHFRIRNVLLFLFRILKSGGLHVTIRIKEQPLDHTHFPLHHYKGEETCISAKVRRPYHQWWFYVPAWQRHGLYAVKTELCDFRLHIWSVSAWQTYLYFYKPLRRRSWSAA